MGILFHESTDPGTVEEQDDCRKAGRSGGAEMQRLMCDRKKPKTGTGFLQIILPVSRSDPDIRCTMQEGQYQSIFFKRGHGNIRPFGGSLYPDEGQPEDRK